MKTISRPFCHLLGALLLVMSGYSSYAAGNPSLTGKNDARYSVIVVNKNQNNKKHRVRLYTDAGRENLLFTVDGVEGKSYQLFIFDMDSRLISQVNIRNRETIALNNISKGNYLFNVLMNDEQIESGGLVVK